MTVRVWVSFGIGSGSGLGLRLGFVRVCVRG